MVNRLATIRDVLKTRVQNVGKNAHSPIVQWRLIPSMFYQQSTIVVLPADLKFRHVPPQICHRRSFGRQILPHQAAYHVFAIAARRQTHLDSSLAVQPEPHDDRVNNTFDLAGAYHGSQ